MMGISIQPTVRRKVFVSYHHAKDQQYANILRSFYGNLDTIIDRSLPKEIDSDDNDYILGLIRTNHLKDSTVTIVLIGEETWARKWVDWEIYSSLRPYGDRTRNGLLGILLPSNSANKLPPRFESNYKVERGYQTGYSLVVNWDTIAPPPGLLQLINPLLYQQRVQEKTTELAKWIEFAFKNRLSPDIVIDNSLPRFKNNSLSQET